MKTIVTMLGVLLVIWGLAACRPDPATILPDEVQQAMNTQEGAYVILTLADTVDEALADQLAAEGIILYDPLGEYRFQAYVPQTAVPALATRQANETIVGIEAIDPATKIKGTFADATAVYTIIVHFYTAPTAAETAVLSQFMQVEQTAVGVMNFVAGEASGAQIPAISALPFVKGIEEAVLSSGG